MTLYNQMLCLMNQHLLLCQSKIFMPCLLTPHPVLLQDAEKRTAMHAAAYCGDTECISALVQAGGKVNPKDSQWLSPLHHAAARGHTLALTELLRNNADLMARDKNWMTPFHLAAMNNHVQCAGKGSAPEQVPVTCSQLLFSAVHVFYFFLYIHLISSPLLLLPPLLPFIACLLLLPPFPS